GFVLGPRAFAGQKSNRLIAHPFAAIERRAEHLRRSLTERRQNIPQFNRVELDWSRGAEDDVRRVASHFVQEFEEIVPRRRSVVAPRLSGGTRLMCFVKDDDAEALLGECAALGGIIAVDDQPRGNYSDPPRTLCHKRRIASLRQGTA